MRRKNAFKEARKAELDRLHAERQQFAEAHIDWQRASEVMNTLIEVEQWYREFFEEFRNLDIYTRRDRPSTYRQVMMNIYRGFAEIRAYGQTVANDLSKFASDQITQAAKNGRVAS